MVTISKPLSAAQVHTYHAEEFTNARANYYTSIANYLNARADREVAAGR